MTQKVNIEIEVEITGPTNLKTAKAEDFSFVSLTVTSVDGQSIPLPDKIPTPRRLVRDLVLAAANELLGVKKAPDPNDPEVQKATKATVDAPKTA